MEYIKYKATEFQWENLLLIDFRLSCIEVVIFVTGATDKYYYGDPILKNRQ